MRLRVAPQLRGLSEAAIADGFRRGLIAFQDGIATPVVIGAATASDNFDRANGPLGSNWSVWSSGTLPVISGQAVLPGNSAQDYRATWKASVNAIGPDQYSESSLTESDTNPSAEVGPGVCLRSDESLTGNGTMYRIVANQATFNNIVLARFNANTHTGITSWSYFWGGGQVLRAEIVGYAIEIFIDGVSVGTYDDSSQGSKIATGQPGICYSSTGNTTSQDNWAGGDLGAVIPPQQVRPDADNVAGGWTTTPLWSKVDEASAGGDVITSTSA